MARGDKDQDKDFLDIDLDEPLEPLDDSEPMVAIEDERIKKGPVISAGDGILLYDNKKYAVGLSWLIAEEEGDTDLASKRAKEFKADFYALRQGVVTQHAFGYLKKGHRIGLPALAGIAGDTLVGEWHGVFVADNGWWYCAVHSDNIAPDGDQLFTSEEAAYNHFIQETEKFRWPRSYAPESWNIPEATGEIPLSKIVNESPPPVLKPASLDAIFSGKRNKNLAVGAMVIIIGLIGVSLVGQQLLPSLVPEQAQVPTPNVQVSDILQAPPKEPALEDAGGQQGDSLTNLSLVQPSALMKDCLDGFSLVSIPLPGWKIKTLRCKETFVEASWTRETGTFEMIEPYLSRFPEGVNKSFTDSNTLVATRRLTGKRSYAKNSTLYERNYAIIVLSKRFGNLGPLDVKEVVPPASQQLLQATEMMQQAGFRGGQNKTEIRTLNRDDLPYLSFKLVSKTPPNMISKYFDIPGFMITSAAVETGNGEWQYDGKLILQPDKRLIEANNKAKAMQPIR